MFLLILSCTGDFHQNAIVELEEQHAAKYF
jgi:hypothetical protein